MRSLIPYVNERNRTRLAWAIIILSPIAASVIARATFWLSLRTFAPPALYEAGPFLALASSPLAAIGPAAGALLLRGSLGFRVAVAMMCGVLGFIAYWVICEPVTWMFGFGIHEM